MNERTILLARFFEAEDGRIGIQIDNLHGREVRGDLTTMIRSTHVVVGVELSLRLDGLFSLDEAGNLCRIDTPRDEGN